MPIEADAAQDRREGSRGARHGLENRSVCHFAGDSASEDRARGGRMMPSSDRRDRSRGTSSSACARGHNGVLSRCVSRETSWDRLAALHAVQARLPVRLRRRGLPPSTPWGGLSERIAMPHHCLSRLNQHSRTTPRPVVAVLLVTELDRPARLLAAMRALIAALRVLRLPSPRESAHRSTAPSVNESGRASSPADNCKGRFVHRLRAPERAAIHSGSALTPLWTCEVTLSRAAHMMAPHLGQRMGALGRRRFPTL